jgi:hypothetical protein
VLGSKFSRAGWKWLCPFSRLNLSSFRFLFVGRCGVRGSPEEAGRHWWREGEGEEEVQRKEERASAIQPLEGPRL